MSAGKADLQIHRVAAQVGSVRFESFQAHVPLVENEPGLE